MKFPCLPITLDQLDRPITEHDIDGWSIDGWNRADGPSLIDAKTDMEALFSWLREHRNSPRTFSNYKKEAHRFLLWTVFVRNKSLSSINRDDVLAYDDFMANPPPDWCGPTKPRGNPEWRPFAYWPNKDSAVSPSASTLSDPKGQLSPSSRQQAKLILGNFFQFLVNAGYLRLNPFAVKAGRSGVVTDETGNGRYLDHETIEYLYKWLDRMPTETERDIQHFERSRWIIAFFYNTAVRIRDITQSTMGSITQSRGSWWLYVMGKGKKKRKVPITDELLLALKRYRRHLGLPDLPLSNETTPLICSLYPKLKLGIRQFAPISPAGVHRCIKEIMGQAADAALADGLDTVSSQLRQASTHWLRHTSASHQLDAGLPLLVVSMNLGHSKLDTTRRYLHAEDDARHSATRGWSSKRPSDKP